MPPTGVCTRAENWCQGGLLRCDAHHTTTTPASGLRHPFLIVRASLFAAHASLAPPRVGWLRGAPAHQQMLPALLLLGHVAPTMRRVSFHATKLQPAHGTQSTQHICVQQHTGLADAQTACTREACTRSLPNEQAAGGTAALVASQCCAYVQAAAPWQHASRNASRGQQLSTQRATMVACAQLAHRRSLADTSRNH
jgi:hypothetical protein